MIDGYFFDNEWWLYKPHKTIRNDKGELHSIDNPAIIFFNEHGGKFREEWYIDGKLNRIDDEPAVITYYASSRASSKVWYKDNMIHRDFGPARIVYDISCDITIIEYYKNGVIDNGNKPARVHFSKKRIKSEEWFCNGQYHNIDGPAIIYYNRLSPGNEEDFYYIIGNKLTFKQYIKVLPIYKRIISSIHFLRRKVLTKHLKNTHLQYNGPDICGLVSSYVV